MVRLKDVRRHYKRPLCLFQFHYGTIKSACDRSAYRCLPMFQFHYGTIKRWVAGDAGGVCERFNSTMVRLKEIDVDLVDTLTMFQFHYGTIKSNGEDENGNPKYVSIPLWYD